MLKNRMLRLFFSGVFAVVSPLAIVASGVSTTGCTQAQWQAFQTDAAQFISYVQTFLQTASVVWSMIVPLLGANAQAAQTAFNDAFVSCTSALGVFQDAIQAATSVQNLDLASLMGPVKDACQKLLAVIAQFQMNGAASNSVLTKQAQVIWNWK